MSADNQPVEISRWSFDGRISGAISFTIVWDVVRGLQGVRAQGHVVLKGVQHAGIMVFA